MEPWWDLMDASYETPVVSLTILTLLTVVDCFIVGVHSFHKQALGCSASLN